MHARSLVISNLATLILLVSCVKKEAQKQSQTQCEANAAYTWIVDRCVAKNSLLGQEAECKGKGAAFIWLNNACMPKEGSMSARARCEAKQDGSRWQLDPVSGVGSCSGPTQIVTAIAECEKQTGHKWDDHHQQCLSPEAQNCNLGGDVWVDGQCLNRSIYQQREACLGRHDGSEWVSLRCITLGERQCNERGFHYVWQAQGVAGGECRAKAFRDYCLDSGSEPDIKKTVLALKAQVDPQLTGDCNAAANKLDGIDALTLAGQQLTSLMPLRAFSELRSLDLQGNAIVSLTALQGLSKLEKLNLTDNRVKDLNPLRELRSLRALHLGGNELSDLAPLAQLPELRSLYLNKNKITDIAPLAEVSANLNGGLAHLSVLSLDDNCGLQNAKPLQRFTQLSYLGLNRTGIPANQLPSFPASTDVDHKKCP